VAPHAAGRSADALRPGPALWRIAAGVLGALSFSTAGTLAAGLFKGDVRRNALAIAILFGTGGGYWRGMHRACHWR
jgi:hypothetical protein